MLFCLAPCACGAPTRASVLDVGVSSEPEGASDRAAASSAHVDSTSPPARAAEPAPTTGDAPPITFAPWDDTVVARARAAKRPILLVACAAWAARCAALERDVLASPEVRRMARAYVAARFDATDTTPENDARLRDLGITGFPAILLIDEESGAKESLSAEASAAELARRLEAFAKR